MKFNVRINDIEARTCDIHLIPSNNNITIEIIKWTNPNSCYTLARFKKDKEGYSLTFIGNRPFEVDEELFMKIAKTAQVFLDKYFEDECDI